MEPHLFRAAVDAELSRISAEREEREKALPAPPPPADDDAPSSLVLYQRMEQLRRGEQALSVQDLMYASVLERFLELGVAMLPRLQDAPDVLEAHADLVALTEGVHSREALDLVKEHVRGVLGPASTAFSNAVVRMSRLQAAQVYAASVLFGYFLRKVDARFQLERSARTLPGDAVDAAFAQSAVEQVIAHFGQLDILVNSAGIIQASTIENADLDEYRRVMDVNVMATLYTCRAAVPHMKARRTGDIINITSQAGRKVAPVFNSYSASKHAANALTEALRREVGEHGVRVSILMPGATQSEVAENMTDPGFKAFMRNHVSKEGVVMPEDIADTIVLMCALPRRAHISEVTVRPTNDVTG